MRAKERPTESVGGTAGQIQIHFIKRQPKPNKIPNKVNHRPEHIQSDTQTLADCGLEFVPVAGHFHALKKIDDRQTDIQKIKSWAVDRLAESLYQGQRSNQHKLACRFWQKSGRRMTHV